MIRDGNSSKNCRVVINPLHESESPNPGWTGWSPPSLRKRSQISLRSGLVECLSSMSLLVAGALS